MYIYFESLGFLLFFQGTILVYVVQCKLVRVVIIRGSIMIQMTKNCVKWWGTLYPVTGASIYKRIHLRVA